MKDRESIDTNDDYYFYLRYLFFFPFLSRTIYTLNLFFLLFFFKKLRNNEKRVIAKVLSHQSIVISTSITYFVLIFFFFSISISYYFCVKLFFCLVFSFFLFCQQKYSSTYDKSNAQLRILNYISTQLATKIRIISFLGVSLYCELLYCERSNIEIFDVDSFSFPSVFLFFSFFFLYD